MQRLSDWAVHNPLLVMLAAAALVLGGGYAFWHVNIEAYPDPAPAIIEVIAQLPGASAEEVERLVTIPLEVALAGMPGLESTRSKSLFGLCHIRNQFTYATDYRQARQEVVNRLRGAELPEGVSPIISPASPIGEIIRFSLYNPRHPATGKPVYTLGDLQALEDFVIERELMRVPRIAGVTGVGGVVKRYEVHPDPQRLYRYGITLGQLEEALGNANANGSGNNLTQGSLTIVVRSLGLIGGGQDPQQLLVGVHDPVEAAAILRAEEARRCKEIRQVVVATVNNVPIRVDQLVEGGPLLAPDGEARVDDQTLLARGVVVGHRTRQGQAGISRPKRAADGTPLRGPDGALLWEDEDDVVQGIVLLRKGEQSLPALRDVLAKIDELNESGRLLPGVKIVPYYNRTTLIERTTETVHENLIVGMALVTVILLMFLSNVRAALIAAINIPLALLFAFGVLFARGKSANLLSIGAVDFGIIVDSTVIIVEAIYRSLAQGEHAGLSIVQRVARAVAGVQRSVFFATAVMVCALLPLFTMKGPEGQIFGPMADTYAFALGGAVILALTVSPVLCALFLKNLQPRADNLLVRTVQGFFVRQLHWLLPRRWLVLACFLALLGLTGFSAARVGREFMPELEEGGILIRGTFPVNISFEEAVARSRQLRHLLRAFEEFRVIPTVVGRPDDGTDPTGYYNMEANLPLRPQDEWPVDGTRGRPRTKAELVADLSRALQRHFPGVSFDISQIIRDNVLEALSGVKGENSIKLFGPDLKQLERSAMEIREALASVPGVQNAGVFRILGQANLELAVDRQKCARWGVSAADVREILQSAVGGTAVTSVQEGGKTYDLTVRWPERLRDCQEAILAIPVPVKNRVASEPRLGATATPLSRSGSVVSATGTSQAFPTLTGSAVEGTDISPPVAMRRLGDLVTPLGADGQPDPNGSFLREGASTIYREQGQRFIAIKFEVRGRDLASTVAEARHRVEPLVHSPYRTEWSGEFRQMEQAEQRIAHMFALSMVLIVLLIYLAFRSLLDTAVVLANVLAMAVGGFWALQWTGLNFNISAAVGFISVLGVAVMNGLLLVSCLNRLRAQGVELREALLRGTQQLVRPIVMTALAAMLGLLPAALSTKMGSECQKPLAVVVVGGMISTILCLNLVPVLYSLYGQRTPPTGAGEMAH